MRADRPNQAKFPKCGAGREKYCLTLYRTTAYMLVSMKTSTTTRATMIAGALAAFGATACCFGPLLLVTLGLGGAWVSSLRALEAYQPLLVLLTLALIGIAFYRLYIQPRQCGPDDVCVKPDVLARQRLVFWLVVLVIAAMFAFPLYAPFFY